MTDSHDPNTTDPQEPGARFRKILSEGEAHSPSGDGEKAITQPGRYRDHGQKAAPNEKIDLGDQPTVVEPPAGSPTPLHLSRQTSRPVRILPSPRPGRLIHCPVRWIRSIFLPRAFLRLRFIGYSPSKQRGGSIPPRKPGGNGKGKDHHRRRSGNFRGCLVRGIIICLFALVLGLVISGAFWSPSISP